MNQTIIAQTFTTSDAATFGTRKEATEHQALVNRIAKVKSVIGEAQDAGLITSETSVEVVIATLADKLLAALNNPLGRGRKAAAVAA